MRVRIGGVRIGVALMNAPDLTRDPIIVLDNPATILVAPA
jgi:hypothetical protein